MRPPVSTSLAFLLTVITSAQEPRMASSLTVDHTAFDTILRATVRDERIDYVAVRDQHLAALSDYLDTLAKVDVEALPQAEKLPYWFNLYNASMVFAIVGRLRADWTPAEGDYGIFKEKLVRVRAGSMSLDDVEHQTVRKLFKEPRLHVALVCGARSCPPLLARAYRADDLDAVLSANMRRFVSDPARNKIDARGKKLQLSRIFDWFKDDFGGEPGVRKLVGEIAGQDVSKYALSYLEYDWQLNLAKPENGLLLRVTRAARITTGAASGEILGELSPGDLLHAVAEKDSAYEVVVPRAGDKRGFVSAAAVAKL